MQRSKGTEVKIPPNLLKNFNVFEMLEPQKHGANSDATTVEKLIDIDDSSRDSGFQDSDLHPAFFDKNRDFDLVDLYQNIFVTPQHIKKTEFSFDVEIETSGTTSSDSNVMDDGFKHTNVSDAGFKQSNVMDAGFKHSNVSDAGFKQFFDVLESGQKVDWTNIPKPEEEIITKHDFIEKKPKVLVPKVFTEPDADPDLVYEVLAQKNMEKLILDSVRNSSSPKVKTSELKELETPKIHKSDVVPELSRFYSVNAIAKSSKFETGINDKIPRPSETESPKIQKSDVVPELSRFYSVNSIAKGSKFETGINDKIPRPSETYMKNNSSSNFIVRAIPKDEKVYKKKCVKKPKSQTADFNRGPDFYEKKIVLPQIMARLDARLAYLHERENQKKRLILDTSSKPVKAEEATNVNAEVKPKNQVLSNIPKPKAQVLPTKKETPSKVLHIASSSGIHSLNNNMKIQEEAQLCINKISKDIRVHTTDRTCLNCGKSPVNKVENHAATSSKTDYGKLSPIVLMEDCNRERLRALKQSQMFKNFVLKGEFGSFIYE